MDPITELYCSPPTSDTEVESVDGSSLESTNDRIYIIEKPVHYWWSPSSCKGPYTPEVLEFTESSITFDGYFYESALPQQRILKLLVPDYVRGSTTYMKRLAIYHIEIYEKIEGKDTSTYTPPDPYDEDAGICFFPTNHITLRFRVLNKDFDNEETFLDSIKAFNAASCKKAESELSRV
jgi:hypothetical protein